MDLETTGLNPERDAIIEIGLVTFTDHRVLDTFSTLVNPNRNLPFFITQLTGIRDNDLRDAPNWHDVRPDVERFIGNSIIIGHNVEFDLSFLARGGLRLKNRVYDTFSLANILLPHATRYGLQNLVREFGISVDAGHRAGPDADASRQLFLTLCERAEQLPLPVIQEINRLAQGTRWPLAPLFRSFESAKARTVFVGSIGAQLKDKGFAAGGGFGMLLREKPEDDEELLPQPELASSDIPPMRRLLEPGGLLAQSFEGYEFRPQQIAMLEAVVSAFRDKQALLVEAGTGTGKSLAYLVPAAHFAVSTGKRVVVSTNTINLQDQLFRKDIPDLKNILPFSFRAAILKGRFNYLCMRKLQLIKGMGAGDAGEMQILARLLIWLQTTATGDQAELFLPTEADRIIWNRVAADSESCLGEQCGYAREGTCYLQRARRKAENAHIIVVNHALLLADAATENSVVPDFRYLIIDEAHHLEEATTKHLSFHLSQAMIDSELSVLSGGFSRRGQGGLVEQIRATLASVLQPAVLQQAETLVNEIGHGANNVNQLANSFFYEVDRFLFENGEGESEYSARLLLNDPVRKQPAWSQVEIAWDNTRAGIAELCQSLAGLQNLCWQHEGEFLDDLAPEHWRDLNARAEFWSQMEKEVSGLVFETRANRIDWLEKRPDPREIEIHSAPLHVGEMVRKYLLDRHDSVVFTSATLRIGEDFSFLRSRLGLESALELVLDSPFDYRSSTLIYHPRDIPEQSARHYQEMVTHAVDQVIRALEGRTLVLFTSYRQLRATVNAIGPALSDLGITILEQGGGGSRAQLLQGFREEKKAALFGTRSFWEGVDVVGPALSCVIIVRFPFSVPTDPIFAARAETYEDPFREFSLPDAVLRFKQGFGRLIRSKSDRGVLVILDSRLSSKSYGKTFLRSLPTCRLEEGRLSDLGRRVGEWIDGKSG